MSTQVIMPQMGESIAEGTITKWLKKVGRPGQARRADLRDLDRQGRRRDPVPGRGDADRDQGERGSDRRDQHRRRDDRRGGRAAGDGRDGPARRHKPRRGGSAQALRAAGRAASDSPLPLAQPAAPAAATPRAQADAAPPDRRPARQPAPYPHPHPRPLPPRAGLRRRGSRARPDEDASEGDRSSRSRIASGERSSPLVRKIAQEHTIDIREVEGTGIHNRVTKNDILSHLENRKVAVAAAGPGTRRRPPARPPPPRTGGSPAAARGRRGDRAAARDLRHRSRRGRRDDARSAGSPPRT